jgi:hypothetical protein
MPRLPLGEEKEPDETEEEEEDAEDGSSDPSFMFASIDWGPVDFMVYPNCQNVNNRERNENETWP